MEQRHFKAFLKDPISLYLLTGFCERVLTHSLVQEVGTRKNKTDQSNEGSGFIKDI